MAAALAIMVSSDRGGAVAAGAGVVGRGAAMGFAGASPEMARRRAAKSRLGAAEASVTAGAFTSALEVLTSDGRSTRTAAIGATAVASGTTGIVRTVAIVMGGATETIWTGSAGVSIGRTGGVTDTD